MTSSSSDAHWNESFSHRPSWCDARMSLEQIRRGKATGNKPGLWVRSGLQWILFRHGCFIQKHCLEVLFLSVFVLCLISAGLRDAKILTDINKLWIPKGGRLERETEYRGKVEAEFYQGIYSGRVKRNTKLIEETLFRYARDIQAKHNQLLTRSKRQADENQAEPNVPSFGSSDSGLGGGFQVTIQTPRKRGMNILTREDLLLHVKVMEDVAQLSVNMYGVNWTMSDLCFRPPAPEVDVELFGMRDKVNVLLDKVIPCLLITPLDCFWDGAKPLGPHPAIKIPDIFRVFLKSLPPGDLSWKNFDPVSVMNEVSSLLPTGDIDLIVGTFQRAGVGSAYQNRVCIDFLDPECPETAPNYVDMCRITQKFVEWNEQRENPIQIQEKTTAGNSTRKRRQVQNSASGFTSNYDYNVQYTDYYEDLNDTKPHTGKAPSSGSGGGGDDLLSLFGSIFGTDEEDEVDEPEVCRNYTDSVREVLRSRGELFREFLPESEVPKLPDYGQILTNGCPGFARSILHWPEPMIIGGIGKENGKIVKAEGLQTVMMLAGGSDVYNRFRDCSKGKVCNITKPTLQQHRWSPRAASVVLDAWQRKFVDYIYNHENNSVAGTERQVHPLAATSLTDMLEEFSKFKPYVILVGYFLMLIYAGFCLFSIENKGIESCSGLAVAGVLLVTFASVSGLGFSTLIGVQFNAATTQIVPFLTLGLGVDDMFLLVHNYKEVVSIVNHHELGFLLKETGLSVLLTSINNVLAFLAGSLIPVPAMKDFCIQTAILLSFNVIAILTIFPAMMAIDLFRRKCRRVDILCCVKFGPEKTGTVPNGVLIASSHQVVPVDLLTQKKIVPLSPATDKSEFPDEKVESSWCENLSLEHFVNKIYSPFLEKLPVKICVLVIFAVFLSASIYGVSNTVMGLDLTDVIPKGTPPYSFLEARQRYFSFYPMFTVLQGPIDFPNKQQQIKDYRADLQRSEYTVAGDEGKLGEYWLNLMIRYFTDLQNKYDRDVGNFTIQGSTVHSNASVEGRLAFKIICNTGPGVNCSRNNGVTRIVDRHGYLNKEGFYKYLTVWRNLDDMMYYLSQAGFFPSPPRWNHHPGNLHQDIPESYSPLYSQIPFFLNGLVDTTATVDAIRKIRAICENYTAHGLANFPKGIPFTFWEQYLYLIENLLVDIAIITGCVFLVITLLLMSPWTAAIIVSILLMMVVELCGFMGLVGLKLNPISVVSLITAVGIGVEFTVHLSLSFLTNIGTRNERMTRTLEHMFVPVTHGGVSTLLGIIMLAFSEFEFIVRYFFMVMAGLIVIGLLNGLILLPVVLSLIGPTSEVRTVDGSNCLPPPSPRPTRSEKSHDTEMNHVDSKSELANGLPTRTQNGHLVLPI